MEENKDYHAYRYGDHLTPGSELKIEHSVVCENVDISTLITMGTDTNQFLETIRKYETVTELNRSMLVELIDSIYVYQAEGTGKDRKQRVEINYRFLAGSQCGIA